jgi:hypothetical protein
MEAIGKMSARGKTISIDNYVVTHVACGGERIDNEIRQFYEANEMNRKISINHIECYSRGDPAGKVAGSITFFPKGQIPVSRMYGDDCSGWVFALFYELDRYKDIIDTLRYEKSVYVYVEWDENGVINHGWLSNSTSLKYKSW